MSLYKNKEDVTTTVVIKREEGKIELEFSADCGKFGTDEMLDAYSLTPERLLEVLQEYDNYLDNEL
tara:strand:- start:584 stop:781 length:198 start_codon:yes stop_codon:yes gene_type:complete